MGWCETKPQYMPDGTPVTPLPKKKIMALVICSMTWGFQMNIIFPFMPFMVDWMRGTTEDSGMYVGILASAYFWGQFIASFIWPPLSDRIGRKKSLIWGQLALTLPFVGFAFTRSYWGAVGWRFLNGVLQSNSPITKAYIADICDRTNSAAGMSVMAFSWGVSNVIAPTVGGLLAEPCLAYPALFPVGSWQYWMFSHETGSPYALPSLFVFVFGFIFAIPMVLLWLPETSPVTLCDVLHGRCSRDKAAYRHLDDKIVDEDNEDAHACTDKADACTLEKEESASDDTEEGVAVPIPTYWEMMTARDSGTALGTLALLCPAWITYQELFPLFCKASPQEGGIGFTAYQIGTAMTITGVVMVIYQPLFFPKLQRHFGNVRCYRYGSMSFNILLVVFPFSHFLWNYEKLLWAWIFFQRIWEVVTATAMWMPSFIMIMNTALPEYQGRMQGMAGAVQMSLMAISPTMGGTIWNYTLGKPWPISPHMTYWCIQVLTLLMLALACYLPDSLNFPKSELLKRNAAGATAGAVGNGRSLGMTPLARSREGKEHAAAAEGGDDERDGLLHEADV